jgi:hypothetical protein
VTLYPTAHQAATIDALMDQTGLGPLYATNRAFRDQVDHIVSTLAPAMIWACVETIDAEPVAQDFSESVLARPLQDRRRS